jgi:hypothetical protein
VATIAILIEVPAAKLTDRGQIRGLEELLPAEDIGIQALLINGQWIDLARWRESGHQVYEAARVAIRFTSPGPVTNRLLTHLVKGVRQIVESHRDEGHIRAMTAMPAGGRG